MVQLKVKLGPKGQVVIPKIFRNEFKIYPGQEVILKEEKEGVMIKKIEDDPIKILKKIAEEATKRRKGNKLKINIHAIEEEYEERTKKAGLIK